MKPIYTTTMPTSGRFTGIWLRTDGMWSNDYKWDGDILQVYCCEIGRFIEIADKNFAAGHDLFITALEESE